MLSDENEGIDIHLRPVLYDIGKKLSKIQDMESFL